MAELTVDLTYGSALYQAAVEENKTDLILEETQNVMDIFRQEPEFYKLITYPTISAEERKDIVKQVFEGRVCKEVLNLLYVLIDKGRTGRYPEIIKAYKDMVDQSKGVTYGTIYSVEPLTEAQLCKFEKELEKLLKENIKLENKLDSSLIGGVKILVDGRMIDASIRNRLNELGSRLV